MYVLVVLGVISSSCHRYPALRKVAHHLAEEAIVGPKLRHVPHHDAAEAAELLGVLDRGLELLAVGVAAAGARVGRDAEERLDVGVLAALGPLVPDVKVEGVLRIGADLEVGHAAPVVVELDHDEVKGHGVQRRADSGVREYALGRSRQVKLLAARAVHEASELGAKGRQVVCRRLKVEVKAVHYGAAERAVDIAAGLDGPEHGAHALRCALGIARRAPATLGVRRTTE